MTRRDLLQIPPAASLRKAAGYRTALFGDWGLGGPGAGSVPDTRGFDEFYGYLDQQHDFLYWEFHENRFAQAIRTDSPLFPVKPTRA